MSTTEKQKQAIRMKEEEKMKTFFPDYENKELWNRKSKQGYTTIPRAMTLILALMDTLEKGKPMSNTYLTLWCFAWDKPFVQIKNENEFATHSGFSGERAVSTWKSRMRLLQEWGFIECVPGEFDYSYILILNPHIVLEELKEKGILQNSKLFNMLKARDIDLNGKGFERSIVIANTEEVDENETTK